MSQETPISVLPNEWDRATENARSTAVAREMLLLRIKKLSPEHASVNSMVKTFLQQLQMNVLDESTIHTAKLAAKGNRPCPSRSVLMEWFKAYGEGGVHALLPSHKGRVRAEKPWYGRAFDLYNSPTKPAMAAVARHLIEVDGHHCTVNEVTSFLKGLAYSQGAKGKKRLGAKLYKDSQMIYTKRHTNDILVGDIYMADGYKLDAYLQHPLTGSLWRPEITAVMDVKSRYIVGVYWTDTEKAEGVRNAFTKAFINHKHVCPMIYVDNGSGFIAKEMIDQDSGYYSRAGVVEVLKALPSNAKAKGQMERFFRIVKDDFLKLWAGDAYCGHDMAKEVSRVFCGRFNATRNKQALNQLKTSQLPPTLGEFAHDFAEWLDRYHQRPNPEYPQFTRAEVFAELQRIEPVSGALEMLRPQQKATVKRGKVRFETREYAHPDLHQLNNKTILVEYDLHDNDHCLARDEHGRLLCKLNWIKAKSIIPKTIADERREKSVQQRIKRLEAKKTRSDRSKPPSH